jgi:hypothetical protein
MLHMLLLRNHVLVLSFIKHFKKVCIMLMFDAFLRVLWQVLLACL